MIDENLLIEKLYKIKNKSIKSSKVGASNIAYVIEKVIEIIKSESKIGEWIPVAERLPEQSLNSVIGWDTYRERCVFVQYYMNEWVLGNHESVNIVAWQPLPEPYEVRENERS